MKPLPAAILAALLATSPATGALTAHAAPSASPWESVAGILQTPDVFAGGYHRFNLPRKDLIVKVGDVAVAPELALGSWVGFSGDPGDAMMMGDLVLTTQELGPVLAELARDGVDVSAIHNHLVGEEPRLVYVHVHGHGDAVDLARRIDRAVTLTKTPRPVKAALPQPLAIDTTVVFQGMGRSGKAHGAVAQLAYILVPGAVSMHGAPLTPALAYGSPINIQMAGPSRAVATGDFAVTGEQVADLLRALAAHGIVATALHTHMIGESPSIFFVHFWADGSLPDVVKGLRAAVDAAQASKGAHQ